jgi:hypothetical protein
MFMLAPNVDGIPVALNCCGKRKSGEGRMGEFFRRIFSDEGAKSFARFLERRNRKTKCSKRKEAVMRLRMIMTLATSGATVAMLRPTGAQAQRGFQDEEVTFARRNLGGPRLGITYITGQKDLWYRLNQKDMGRTLSQFGWHFEHQVIPEGGGPQFVVQFVPLVAGVEYGKFIPSATLAMGVRFPNGIEFGLGPNLLLVGGENGAIKTALVLGLGKSFNYGGVSIPLNLVYATNPDGNRVSVIFGYAIASARKTGRFSM